MSFESALLVRALQCRLGTWEIHSIQSRDELNVTALPENGVHKGVRP
jgi:hypothetical protein